MIKILRESNGQQTLSDWVSNPRNKKRYGNDKIMVVCLTPYEGSSSDDCPGVLFDGSFEDLENRTGDNYLVDFDGSDSYDTYFVTGSTYKRLGSTDYLELSVDC